MASCSWVGRELPIGKVYGKIECAPWAVMIVLVARLSRGVKKGVHCGGTLISSELTITAAKCSYKKPELLVYAGMTVVDHTRQTGQIRTVIGRTPDVPKQKHRTSEGFSILKVDSPFILNDEVQQVLLPRFEINNEIPLTLASWGCIDSHDDNDPYHSPSHTLTISKIEFRDNRQDPMARDDPHKALLIGQSAGSSLGKRDLGAGAVEVNNEGNVLRGILMTVDNDKCNLKNKYNHYIDVIEITNEIAESAEK